MAKDQEFTYEDTESGKVRQLTREQSILAYIFWTELTASFLVDKFKARAAKKEFVQTEQHT